MITLDTKKQFFELGDTIEARIPAEILAQLWAGGNNSSCKFGFEDLRKDIIDHQKRIAQILHVAQGEAMPEDLQLAYFYVLEHTEMALKLIDALEKTASGDHLKDTESLSKDPKTTAPPITLSAALASVDGDRRGDASTGTLASRKRGGV